MKKNLALFFILIGLISFAYFWEQLGNKKMLIQSDSTEKVFSFDINSIFEISLKETRIFKKNQSWWIGDLNYYANQNKIDLILKTLSGIVSVQVINEQDTGQFFLHQGHTFNIRTKDEDLTLRLGDISPVTGFFYLEKYVNNQRTLYLVKDSNVYEGIYSNEVEAEFQKYLTFKNIITMKPMELIEQRFLPALDFSKILSLRIDSKINRWFEVDFLNNKTTPKILRGLKYQNLKNVFLKLLNSVSVIKIEKIGKNILSDKLSEIEINNNQQLINIQLFGTLNGKNGYYAVVKDDPLIYHIAEKGKDFFFANVQDYWLKKLNFEANLSEKKSFQFLFGQQNQLYNFKVENIEQFKVEANDDRVVSVDDSNMNLLFNLIFNLVDFSEAKFVTDELTIPESDQTTFELLLFNKSLKVIFLPYLIKIHDLESKVEFSYPHQNLSIDISDLNDFFTLK